MSYYQATRNLNHVEDVNALDQLAKTNYSAKEKQLSMMKNLLDELSGLIGGYNSSKIDAIAIKLQEQGYGCVQLQKACKIIPERLDRFPSFKDIKSVLKEFNNKEKEYIRDPQNQLDQDRYTGIKNLFLSKANQEKLTYYVAWWLKEVYELTPEYLPDDISIISFEMPALFDWYDNFGAWDLERIKLTANKKNDYVIKQNKDEKPRKEMWINKSDEYKKFLEV
jgi:hypothetical protein